MADYGVELTSEEQTAMDAMLATMLACLTEKTTKSFDAAVALMVQYSDTQKELLDKKIAEVEAGENPDLVEALALLSVIKEALDGDDADGLQKLEKLFSDASAAKELSASNATSLAAQQKLIEAQENINNALSARIEELENAAGAVKDCAPCVEKMTLVWEKACAGSATDENDHFAATAASVMAKFGGVEAATSGSTESTSGTTDSAGTSDAAESSDTSGTTDSTESTDTTGSTPDSSAGGDGATL